MCRLHLAHLDQLDAMIGALDEQIEQLMHPFCARRELIASIPGIGVGASATVISEIGADPAAWFPSAEHLASKLQRLGNVLQDAGIKADSVASSVTPKSVRAMVEALIDGERRPAVLADLARGSMRSKIPDLQRALEGRFDDHHALMCRLHLAHLDQLDAMIGALDEQIEQLMHPFCARRELIASIPGIGVGASATVISEIGADPAAWFPSAEHLASWVRLCPGNHESAGKRHHGARRTGNQHLQPVLVECAWAAVRTDGYLREYYRRQVRKFGGFRSPAANKKAITTVAHKLIVIIWHVLATGRPHQDLGADYFTTRMDPDKERRRLVAKLEAQGLGVTLEPAA
ncbi:transposase [Mycobacterium tuberculosis]|nr:transposase [Mycobacterium tuberculosis]